VSAEPAHLAAVPTPPGPARTEHRDSRAGAVEREGFEQALALAAEHVSEAFAEQDGWLDLVRAGLQALLELFDEQPMLARYLIVDSAHAGDAVRERRRQVLDRIASLLDDDRAPGRSYPPALTAHAVVHGVLGLLAERLSAPQRSPLTELAPALMSFAVLPFLGVNAARRELVAEQRPAATPGTASDKDVLEDSLGRMSSRASLALSAIAAEPGLNNRQLAARAGIGDAGQTSRLLARLERLGLIASTRPAYLRAGANAWTLTAAGKRVQAAIARRPSAPEPSFAFDLPPEFAGRLEDRAVLMLQVIADQPWLRKDEVADRAGLGADTSVKRLLRSLVDLGLAVAQRDAHGQGGPSVWRLTPAGERLDAAIARDAPRRPPSRALDLMGRSAGGRLSDTAIDALKTIGREPGLGNGEVAARVGVTDQNIISRLLAHLASCGLLENARQGGRHNVWHLTAAGETLERALWQETPPAEQRRHALEMLRERGRLNHRVASLLPVIAAEPDLSNNEIAERIGMVGKAHTSELLARMARFGLIENRVAEPLPFAANAWRLTPSGRELAAALPSTDRARHGRARGPRGARRPGVGV
jgi:DNA-binding MarR family transcriptional regulator